MLDLIRHAEIRQLPEPVLGFGRLRPAERPRTERVEDVETIPVALAGFHESLGSLPFEQHIDREQDQGIVGSGSCGLQVIGSGLAATLMRIDLPHPQSYPRRICVLRVREAREITDGAIVIPGEPVGDTKLE